MKCLVGFVGVPLVLVLLVGSNKLWLLLLLLLLLLSSLIILVVIVRSHSVGEDMTGGVIVVFLLKIES